MLIIIISILLLNSCKSSSDLFKDQYIPDQSKLEDPENSSNVFNESELETIYANKKKVKVALFFPFSGKHKDLGWSLYNAALLSLFDNDLNHNIELVLIDSTDNPVEASQAFREIKNRKIEIVIGPIFTNFVNAISKNALRNSVKAISLSNNQQLMGNVSDEGAVFIGGFLPEQQIDRVVSYALSQNKRNFAILAPNDSYGVAISKMLKDVLDRRYGNLIQSELYNRSSKDDMKRSTIRIVNAFKVPSELAEGGGNKLEEDFTVAQSDKNFAEVIFVPESGKNLAKMVNLIKKHNDDERDIQIVGIGGWDDDSVISDGDLDDIWFAAPIQSRFNKFKKAYYRSYGEEPPRIASIVYDSVAAVTRIIDTKDTDDKQVTNEDFVNFELNGSLGFDGIDGKFRFLENGLVERNFAVLKVNSGDLEIVESPSEIFLKYDQNASDEDSVNN